MRLAEFIDNNVPAIVAEWDLFASSLLPAAGVMDGTALRDHAEQMLRAIAQDLRSPQTRLEQSAKSKGHAPIPLVGMRETAAQTHALQRAMAGFSIRQLVAEYRALRASVLRLWGDAGAGPNPMEDAGRFNEAVDQAIAESVDFYAKEVERWRALLLGMLGHDLRGPLNTILLTSHLIAEMSTGMPINLQTEKLMRSGKRMQELLNDLLDYNRTSLHIGIRVKPEPTNLALVCDEEIELLRAALPASTIEFSTEGFVQGSWDPSRIKQVVSNLVINAAKYGDPSGVISVKLRGDDTLTHLLIENTGPDIPKELMSSLFEPLRRHAVADSENERVSLGLGLFIVQQIALAHGGDITVKSADGKTGFMMTLPKNHQPKVLN